MALLYKNLSKQVDYHHDISAYEESHITKNIQNQTLRKVRNYRIRPHSLTSKNDRQHALYNKWYINPELQYKAQSKNPKNDRKMMNDQEHVYKNLRNPQFWNWVHPFQMGKMPALKTPSNLEKIDGKVLEKFKKFIDESPTHKRLPSIVQHILQQKKNKNLSQTQ